ESMSELNISRRRVLALPFAIAGAAALGTSNWLKQPDQTNPSSIFINQLYNTPDDPDVIAREFANFRTATLMASYSVFFPRFLESRGIDGVKELTNAKDAEKLKTVKNHHRLDVLPAVAAAHLLPRTTSKYKPMLCWTISQALRDSRREVREIMLQNLI